MAHQPKLVQCNEHGSAYCYEQLDGSHVPDTACRCTEDKARFGHYSAICPVDLHRQLAKDGLGAAWNPDLDARG